MKIFNNFFNDVFDVDDDSEANLEQEQNESDDEACGSNGDDVGNDDENSLTDEAKNVAEMSLRVKQLEAEVKNLQDLNLRLRAEFDNFKKRTSKEKQRLYGSGQIDCVSEFLPFFDGVERGFETASNDKNSEIFKGFKALIDSFTQVLNKLQIESFGKKGDEFNPKFHNAIKTLEVEGFGSNLVYEVLQKGYCKGDDVVRHAMVVVANP